MSDVLRVVLLVLSISLFIYVLRKLKKSQLQLMDVLYWLLFSFFILIIGLFPKIGDSLARLVGVASTANFLFLASIFFLILKLFLLNIRVSMLEHRLVQMAQEIAIRDYSKNVVRKADE